jgi:hypothetical protein
MCGELLPALRYSNPTVLVTIASPPSKPAVAAVVGEGEISSLESWKEMPGISIAFRAFSFLAVSLKALKPPSTGLKIGRIVSLDDETKSIFFPLAGNVKSTKLIERFWSSMDSEEVMMKYSSGQVIPDEVEEVEIKI